MSEWTQAMDNLKKSTSSRDAYEAERERAVALLESGQAKDPKAAAKWINKLDAVWGGIYTYEEVASGKAQVSDIYIPTGTPINSNTIKEIQKQKEAGEAVARVSGTKRTTSTSSSGSGASTTYTSNTLNNLRNTFQNDDTLTYVILGFLAVLLIGRR